MTRAVREKRVWRVLVPLDGSRTAHRAIRSLVNRAKREGPIEVVLVGLAPMLARMLPALLASLLFAPQGSALDPLRDARALLAMHGIPYRVALASGEPGRAIAAVAMAHRADEVVIGPIGDATAGETLARRVAARVGARVTFVV